jgi:CubicO group peptidase (beta-lactamase class C family)
LIDPEVKRGAPGRTYSNWGFALLGHVVEQGVSKRFEDVLRERIFAPLEMSNSKLALSPADEGRLAVHYRPEDKPRIARPHWIFGEVAGFGGMTSTAGDLAKFLRYQIRPEQRGDMLDAAEIQALRAARTVGASWQAGSARGWIVIRESDGTIVIEKDGEVDGHSSYMGFSPENNVGVAVAANLGGSSSRAIALPLLKRVVAEARQLHPTNKETAMTLVRKRQWADAEVALVKVVAAAPGDGEAWHQLGVTRYELNDLPGAEVAWSRAAKKQESPASSMFMLAVIAASQGRIDLAFERLNRALAVPEQIHAVAFDMDRTELRILRSDRRWPKILQQTKVAR